MTREEITRTFEIADAVMLGLLRCHAPSLGRGIYGLTDESGHEVAALDVADPAIQRAFEWLAQRGIVELATDERGELIRLSSHRVTA